MKPTVWRVKFIMGTKGDHSGLYDGEISMLLDGDVFQTNMEIKAQKRLDDAFGEGRMLVTKMWNE